MQKIFFTILITISIIISTIIFNFDGFFILPKANNALYTENIQFNHQQVGVYYINLERSKDRMNELVPLLKELNYQFHRVEGVDGSKISNEELKNKVDNTLMIEIYRRNLSNGEVGCFLSHIKALQEFLNSDNEFALILEDDSQFNPETINQTIDFLIKNSQYWDLVSFYSNYTYNKNGNPVDIMTIPNNYHLVKYLAHIDNSTGYIVNRNVAKKLIAKSNIINVPYDIYFARQWEFGFKFRGIDKNIIKINDHNISSIAQSGRAKQLLNRNFFQKFQRSIYCIKTGMMRYLYNYIK